MRKTILLIAGLLVIPLHILFAQAPKIIAYQYWFDDNDAGMISQSVSPATKLDLTTTVTVPALPAGIHRFNIRFKDDSLQYSQVSSAYFVIVPEMLISGYEYWFDNDYGSKIAVNVATTQLLDLSAVITATSLSLGFHAFRIRFKNTTGTWCSTQSDMFYKHGTANQNNLTSYEYWFDDNPAGKVTVSLLDQPTADVVAGISAAALQPGLHRAHVRFRSGDNASIVSSGYFYKSGTANIAENAVSGYRYWFDNDPGTMQVRKISPAASDVILLDSVALPYLSIGKHRVNFEFRDTLGHYSSIVSDSVDILTCQPYAAGAITGPSQVCKGTNGVTFSIPPIPNATGYSWAIPSGATIAAGANTHAITVDFSQAAVSGSVSASGVNPCGSGTASFMVVNVNPSPAPAIFGDTLVCAGATGIKYITESGNSGYTWSVTSGGTIVSGIGTSQVSVNWITSGGSQSVSCGYTNNAGCQGSKTINVTVLPLPPLNRTLPGTIVPNGQTLCADATDTLFVPDKNGSFQVQNGGSAILIAGKDIRLQGGSRVNPGGYLHGYISNDCFYCNAIPHTLPQANKESETAGIPDDTFIGNTRNSTFRVYPNPTAGIFTLESTGSENLSGIVEVYGMHGEKVITEQLAPTRMHMLSLEGKPVGMYIIRVVSDRDSGTLRIIKY